MAGIDGGGFTVQGPITQFGSIFVNGTEYSTSGASVWVGGDLTTERDLRIGQVVRVTGRRATAGATLTATRVDYAPTIVGPLQAVDLFANTLVVAALEVRVVPNTTFGDGVADIDALNLGDFLEVSGYYDADGTVIASRIERKAAAAEVQIRGVVSQANAAAKSFSIGGLRVDYSAAVVVGSFPGGTPVDGNEVEATGALDGATLRASRLEFVDGALNGAAGDQGEIEGAVTSLSSSADFNIGAQRVVTTTGTTFQDGTALDLVVGAIVQVDGTVDAAGSIAATRIEFRHEGELQWTGAVTLLNTAQTTFDILGTTVAVDALTRFEDASGAQLSFALLRVGDYLEVRAYQTGARVVATRVRRESAQSEVDLRGTLSNPVLPAFELLGQNVVTDSSTHYITDGGDVDQATFFALASVGSHTVRVKGVLVQGTTTIHAVEVRLED